MTSTVDTLIARYKDLSSRERLLLAIAALAVSYFAIEWALLTPQLERRAELMARSQERQVERQALQRVLSSSSLDTGPPRSSAQSQQDALQDTANQGERLVSVARTTHTVGPLLRAMVSSTPGLELTSLRSAPATVFYQAPAPDKPSATGPAAQEQLPQAPAADIPTLYTKTVEVSVNGNFLDLLNYLRALKGTSQAIYWDSVSIAVTAHPTASMKLVLKVLTTTPDTPLAPVAISP